MTPIITASLALIISLWNLYLSHFRRTVRVTASFTIRYVPGGEGWVPRFQVVLSNGGNISIAITELHALYIASAQPTCWVNKLLGQFSPVVLAPGEQQFYSLLDDDSSGKALLSMATAAQTDLASIGLEFYVTDARGARHESRFYRHFIFPEKKGRRPFPVHPKYRGSLLLEEDFWSIVQIAPVTKTDSIDNVDLTTGPGTPLPQASMPA